MHIRKTTLKKIINSTYFNNNTEVFSFNKIQQYLNIFLRILLN